MNNCPFDCFGTCSSTIINHVKVKLSHHRSADSTYKFRHCSPTMCSHEAYAMLVVSRGICCICQSSVLLHGWEPNDKRQFSFDRLDDSKTHSADNVQITCLGCNLKKADNRYQPKYGPLFDEYVALVKEFMNERRGGDKVYIQKLAAYLAWLHDEVYGDNKENNWKKRVSPSSEKPTKNIILNNNIISEYIWK